MISLSIVTVAVLTLWAAAELFSIVADELGKRDDLNFPGESK